MKPGGGRLSLSIRAKVLLLSTTLLIIPYVGYQYVQEMEAYLRRGLEESLVGAAQAIAGGLHDRPALFGEGPPGSAVDAATVYASPLREPIQVDGYPEDWAAYRAQAERLTPPPGEIEGAADFGVSYVAGKRGAYLFVLVVVEDDRLVYRSAGPGPSSPADHLELRFAAGGGEPRRYRLETISPGWVGAREISTAAAAPTSAGGAWRIKSEWQERPGGYAVEIRVPLAMVGPRFALTVVDVDGDADRPVRVSTAPPGMGPGRLLLPSPEIEAVIASLGRTPGRRIWVVDGSGRVRARGGSLERSLPPPPANALYAWILHPPEGEPFRESPAVSRRSGPELTAALAGESGTRWRTMAAKQRAIVSAAYPIWSGQEVIGAVLVEETSAAIQTVRHQALANLFNKTLLVFLAAGLLLLFLASRIATRLGRLRDEAEAAIDAHGRVVGTLSGAPGGDEIDDLSRSFSSMMDRLRQYNQYLEQLASRLSHELRTPIAVIRSSLENLELASSETEGATYRRRARDGLTRLSTILARMSEATQLEQLIQGAEQERFDLGALVAASVAAYGNAWPERKFRYAGPEGPAMIQGVPDLVAQLLDKLVGNAVDFGAPDHPVELSVARRGDDVSLAVVNYGSRLPDEMRGTLFESMVSVRARRDPASPHLGLGLYVARLIVEFHRGRIQAENLPDGAGVSVLASFPCA